MPQLPTGLVREYSWFRTRFRSDGHAIASWAVFWIASTQAVSQAGCPMAGVHFCPWLQICSHHRSDLT